MTSSPTVTHPRSTALRAAVRRRLPALRRRSFDLRLIGLLGASLAIVAAAQFLLVGHAVEARLYSEAQDDAAAVARTVEQALDVPGVPRDAVLDEVRGILATTSATSAVTGARLYRRDEVVASAPGSAAAGGGDAYRFAFPLDTARGRFLLEVERHDLALQATTRDLAGGALGVLLVGLPLALPLFYLLGGRRLAAEHRVAVRQSTQDSLTGLGNHRAFQEQLQAAAASGAGSLVLIDLDDFRALNDRTGHGGGDRLLTQVAQVLGELGSPAFRIGGDEFALLVDGGVAVARAVAEEARRRVHQRVRPVTLSAGVAELGDDADDAEAMRDRAAAALFEAKRRGRDAVLSFDDVEEAGTIASSAKVRAVRDLLASDDVEAVFQPIWEPDGTTLVGYEGLARPAPGSGLAGPMDAFEVAARLGRVPELDRMCRQAIFARARALPPGGLLFVNLSPEALGHELIAGDALLREVAAAGLAPERVVLEITERSVTRRGIAIREGKRLRALGFRLAIDDVGAGNSGLEMLRHLPVDFVKIDREVVVGALDDTGARAIFLAIVTFAQETGARVIAEGIETREQLDFVRGLPFASRPAQHLGVQAVQGYLLGRPAPVEEAGRSRADLLTG